MHKNSEIQFHFHVIKINVRMVSQGKDKRVVLFCSALKQGSPPILCKSQWVGPLLVLTSVYLFTSLCLFGVDNLCEFAVSTQDRD